MRDAPPSTLVSVRLVYLARLRETFGCAAETVEWAGDEPPTVDGIVEVLRRRGGAWAAELAPGRAVRFAINHKLAGRMQAIADGDEVAILPPVTGG
jgi:molybdopterin synthase sulfur carrier subunit